MEAAKSEKEKFTYKFSSNFKVKQKGKEFKREDYGAEILLFKTNQTQFRISHKITFKSNLFISRSMYFSLPILLIVSINIKLKKRN